MTDEQIRDLWRSMWGEQAAPPDPVTFACTVIEAERDRCVAVCEARADAMAAAYRLSASPYDEGQVDCADALALALSVGPDHFGDTNKMVAL